MHNTLSSAFVLALSTFAAAAPANDKRSSDYQGDAPAQFSACGASLFMYENQTPQGGCKIATSTDRSGSGEVVIYDGNCADNKQNAGTVIINEGNGPSDPPQEFSKSSVGLFNIQTTQDNCGNDGHGCYPRLVSYGNSFDMWDNPACSQGPRNPAGKRDVEKRGRLGYWWRCQLNCYTPPPPVTCTKKGPDGPTWEEPAPTPDTVSSKQPCPPKEQVASCTIQVSDVTSYANTLTNTHTVTDTTTKGQSVAIGANTDFFSLTSTTSVDFAHAVADGLSIGQTDTTGVTRGYTTTQQPGTQGYYQYTATLICHMNTVACVGGTGPVETEMKFCTQKKNNEGAPLGEYKYVTYP